MKKTIVLPRDDRNQTGSIWLHSEVLGRNRPWCEGRLQGVSFSEFSPQKPISSPCLDRLLFYKKDGLK